MKINIELLNDINFLYTTHEIIIVLPKEFNINMFKKIEYNNRFLKFYLKNNTEKIVILTPNVLKEFNNYPNMYCMDTINYTEKMYVLKYKGKIIRKKERKEND